MLDHDALSLEGLKRAADSAAKERATYLEAIEPPFTPEQQAVINRLTEKAVGAQADFFEARKRRTDDENLLQHPPR